MNMEVDRVESSGEEPTEDTPMKACQPQAQTAVGSLGFVSRQELEDPYRREWEAAKVTAALEAARAAKLPFDEEREWFGTEDGPKVQLPKPTKKREFSLMDDEGVAHKVKQNVWEDDKRREREGEPEDEYEWLLEQARLYKPAGQELWHFMFEHTQRRGPDGLLAKQSYIMRNHCMTHYKPWNALQQGRGVPKGEYEDDSSEDEYDEDGEVKKEGFKQNPIPAHFFEPVPYSQEELDEMEEMQKTLQGLALKDEMAEGIF